RYRRCHHGEADRVESPACAQHSRNAKTIGNHAGDRLADSPQDILDRKRQAEDLAPPTVGLRLRGKEKTEHGAWTETDHCNATTAEHDHSRRAPAMTTRSGARNCGNSRRHQFVFSAL